jgi:hypothetical protein
MIKSNVEELKKTENNWKQTPVAERYRNLIKKFLAKSKRLITSKFCTDINIFDANLIQGCLKFYALSINVLFRYLNIEDLKE